MKFTVLMSVYDKENKDFLLESLESIFNQTLKPDQVVIVKDGPLNKSLESSFEKFLDENITFVQLSQNVGLGKALQIGLEYCSHEIIARMDSDDVSVPTRFETQINYLKRNPNIDVLGSQMGEFTNKVGDLNSVRKVPLVHDSILIMSKSRNPMNHISVMFRKNAVKDSGGYLPLLYLEDYYLWVRMLVNDKKFSNIDEILVYARVGNGMYKRRGNKKQIEGFKVILKLLKENKLISNLQSKITILKVRIFLLMPEKVKKIMYKIAFRSNNKNV